jgi:hypothetical protein
LTGGDFSKAEIAKLAGRTFGGEWYAVKPAVPNAQIAIWGVRVRQLDLYAMLFINQQYRESNPNFTRSSQALMIRTAGAFQARGYWYDPNRNSGGEEVSGGGNNEGTEDGDTY